MSDAASISSGSFRGREHTAPSTIAAFNKRRLQGDYGIQPNKPSVGIHPDSSAAHRSAMKASKTQLGPKLWFPSEHASANAHRASTLASQSSSSYIPDAHWVEDPEASALASRAATSAIRTKGEDLAARAQPHAYEWGKTPTQWSHLGARDEYADFAQERDDSLSSHAADAVLYHRGPDIEDNGVAGYGSTAGIVRGAATGARRSDSFVAARARHARQQRLNQSPTGYYASRPQQAQEALGRSQPQNQAIDISKVLTAAQTNAKNRLDNADNHLPANFGQRTEEEQAQRRQQVLSLIAVADQRVKSRMQQMDRDRQTPHEVFGSIEFQKIAMDVAQRTQGPRMENHGKLNLGGGLYMTQDEVDDIARRHVQPVLDKVGLVAEKKRIADREHAERQAVQRQLDAEEKARSDAEKAASRQRAADEKAARKQEELSAKQKRDRAAARARENHEQGSHLWHWQQVEAIKEDVKEAKNAREEKTAEVARLTQARTAAQEDLALMVERHRELKKNYFDRGEAIDSKAAEYDPDTAETASLFDLKQQRETVKQSTRNAKAKRVELEERIQTLDREIAEAETESKEAETHHRELKKKYFDAKTEAEAAEKQFQIDEEARLKREAEERAKAEAEAEERRKAEAAASSQSAAASAPAAGASTPAPAAAAAPSKKDKKAKKGKEAAPAPAAAATPAVPIDYKAPQKSKLISMGDARTGPVLAGYKTVTKAPAKPNHEAEAKGVPAEEVEGYVDGTEQRDVAPPAEAAKTESEAPKAEEAKVEEPKVEAPKVETKEAPKPEATETKEEPKAEPPKPEHKPNISQEAKTGPILKKRTFSLPDAKEKPAGKDSKAKDAAPAAPASPAALAKDATKDAKTSTVSKTGNVGAEADKQAHAVDGYADGLASSNEATAEIKADAAERLRSETSSEMSNLTVETNAPTSEPAPAVPAIPTETSVKETKDAAKDTKEPETSETFIKLTKDVKADIPSSQAPSGKVAPAVETAEKSTQSAEAKAEEKTPAASSSFAPIVTAPTQSFAEATKLPAELDATPTVPAGEGVAGAVGVGADEPEKLKDEVPLGDQFSGFDSSNVKESKVDGVFKEDL